MKFSFGGSKFWFIWDVVMPPIIVAVNMIAVVGDHSAANALAAAAVLVLWWLTEVRTWKFSKETTEDGTRLSWKRG